MAYKFTDKAHPPVPALKVGDRCYAHWPYGRAYDHVSTCEVRKVEVKWCDYGNEGHWRIDYYIRTDIDHPGMKSTSLFPYSLGDDGSESVNIFRTPQEVMDENIARFKEAYKRDLEGMLRRMGELGYLEEQKQKLLEE